MLKNLEIQHNRVTRHKLTVTAHKAEVRIKIAKGSTPEEEADVIAKFTDVAERCPDLDKTLRGRASNRFELDDALIMVNDSKKETYKFPFKS